jgi:hypothetical protein
MPNIAAGAPHGLIGDYFYVLSPITVNDQAECPCNVFYARVVSEEPDPTPTPPRNTPTLQTW